MAPSSGLLALVALLTQTWCATGLVLEGSDTSYTQFHQWNGGANATISLEFATHQADALLLYADSRISGQYVQLSLAGGEARLRFNWGGGMTSRGGGVLRVGRDLNDGAWHSVAIVNAWPGRTTLVVDRTLSDSVVAATGEDADGNRGGGLFMSDVSKNSYLYVGGLPAWYGRDGGGGSGGGVGGSGGGAGVGGLALPTALSEPRLRGAVRNVRYRDAAAMAASGLGGERIQEMMAYKGVRASNVDACEHRDPCLNGGKCLPTDSGPFCDCSQVDFTGKHCEIADPPAEATFLGGEYLTYDLAQRGFDPILSANDEITFFFKTRRSSGLLFYTGNEYDFLAISLKAGGVALSVQLGQGKLKTDIKPEWVRFDDNAWHHVKVTRKSGEVTLTVDGLYTEKWITSGTFDLLASSTILVGGSEASYELKTQDDNWAGCMKKVIFKADSLVLDLLRLGRDDDDENSLVSVIGEVEWGCRDIAPGSLMAYKSDLASLYEAQKQQQGGVISFTREGAFLVLPSWKVNLSGSISLKFRTTEHEGLLLFNGGGGPEKDYFAMELLDGHLHLHLDLGTGLVKVRASRVRLSDGEWHDVELTLKRKAVRITIDGVTEAFKTKGDANQLDLVGSLYVGSVDYMDPYLKLPPTLWTAALRRGFVGCLKDLFINGAAFDVVTYAHQQDVGSIRSSCHKMPGQCHDRPCMHGGTCTEGWNRYICDCTQTSFSGATCGDAAGTLKFEGSHSMGLLFREGVTNEADEILLRFRTKDQAGLLLETRHDRSPDRLQLALEGGRVRVSARLGSSPTKVMFAGQSLNDDIYHAVRVSRRGAKISAIVDDDEAVVGDISGYESLLSYSRLFIGGYSTGGELLHEDSMVTMSSSGSDLTPPPGFTGSMQQLSLNGLRFFELASSGQLSNHALNAILVETPPEETIHHAVSFGAQSTHLGLPQMKAYDSVDVGFQFRTFEQSGLLLYNAGKASDFISVELLEGRLHYTLNLGYGPITIKDNAPDTLSDNQWHRVRIGRPSRYKHTLMVDGHIATASTRGDNYHLDLDGILFLGGVRENMYDHLPRPLVSKTGFQGCFSSFETNGELLDPVKHALVPSPLVEEGCEDSVAYEWRDPGGGVVRYTHAPDKRPDTNQDLLSVGIITPSFDAVILRIDSHRTANNNDFLQLEIIGGKVFLNYNLGSKDITVGDIVTKVNDGRYHVIRFTRTGVNATLQIDDNPPQHKFPQGNRYLTVFNEQSVVEVGGRWNPNSNRVERPFIGVLAGAHFNGLRPLELAKEKDSNTVLEGNVRLLPSIPFDFRDQHPEMFTKEGMRARMDKVYANRGEVLTGSGVVLTAHSSVVQLGEGGHSNGGGVISVIDGGGNGAGGDGGGGGYFDCDDEEECVGEGSGSGEGDGIFPGGGSDGVGGGGVGVGGGGEWQPRGADGHHLPLPPYEPSTDQPRLTTEDWHSRLYPRTSPPPPPTLFPIPSEGSDEDFDDSDYDLAEQPPPPHSYPGYDDKWNETPATAAPPTDKPPSKPTKSMPGTMVLVIGIILGAFVAMVLIVVIVLKMRTRVDGSIKCEEQAAAAAAAHAASSAAPRYQFAAAAGAAPNDYGDLGGGGGDPLLTATTSMLEGNHVGGGFYNNNNNLNGDRSRLFRKTNGSKPVREWYV